VGKKMEYAMYVTIPPVKKCIKLLLSHSKFGRCYIDIFMGVKFKMHLRKSAEYLSLKDNYEIQ
jgi:hypothetical protein